MILRDQLLRRWTGKDSTWWVHRVQELIVDSMVPNPDNPNHPDVRVHEWLDVLIDDIVEPIENDPENNRYDGNMRVAATLAIVLTTWSSRISHAKAYDSNRPLRLRRRALAHHAKMQNAMIEAIVDERLDSRYFAGQEWNPPYGPSARGGDFV